MSKIMQCFAPVDAVDERNLGWQKLVTICYHLSRFTCQDLADDHPRSETSPRNQGVCFLCCLRLSMSQHFIKLLLVGKGTGQMNNSMRDKSNGELHSCKRTNRWLENPQLIFMGYFARKDRENTFPWRLVTLPERRVFVAFAPVIGLVL